jgi:hypothetical protein
MRKQIDNQQPIGKYLFGKPWLYLIPWRPAPLQKPISQKVIDPQLVAVEKKLKAFDSLAQEDLFSEAQLENFHRKIMNSIKS